MKPFYCFIVLCFIGINFLAAQINTELHFDDPLKSGVTKGFTENDVNAFNIELPFNSQQTEEFLEKESTQEKKLVFGENISTNISLSNCKWININDKRACKMKLHAANAKTLNIQLTNFHLSESAKLFLYNSEGTVVMGPITAAENNNANIFLSSIFPGEDLVIELTEDISSKEKSSFIISRITYGIIDTYKGILNDVGTSGTCEENVTCVLGGWHDEAKSAVRLLIKGNTLCSACLINNTLQDGTPYVLTANHCVVGEKNLENDISFVFFFRSRYCDSTKPVKNYKVYNQGYLRAHYYNSDFALLEMMNRPDSAENYYYAGWSRDTAQGSFAACLHFPQGDLMKYSECTLPIIDTAYGASGIKNKMYWVRWTGSGVTEDGSSGGALFNINKQVIGELYDGPSHCGAHGNNKSDYFGGFFASWRGGGKITNRLKDWLDPLGTNATSINGAYITMKQKITKAEPTIRNEISSTQILFFPNPARDKISILVPQELFLNKKTVALSVFTINSEKVLSANLQSAESVVNIGVLKDGIYFIKISTDKIIITQKLIVLH